MSPTDASSFYEIIKDGGVAGVFFLVSLALGWYALRQEKKIENKDALVKVLDELNTTIKRLENSYLDMRASFEAETEKTRAMYERLMNARFDAFGVKFDVFNRDLVDMKEDIKEMKDYCIKKD